MNVRKWLRIAGIAAASVLAVVAVLFLLLQTGPGRSLATAAIESAASSETLKIKIEGLEGTLPGSPRIAKVTLADAKGPWLVLQDVRADWSPFALIAGDIVAEEIAVGRAHWLRQPAGGDDSSDDGGEVPALSIARLRLDAVSIAEGVTGTPGTFAVEGKIDLLEPSEAATVALKATELGGARLIADVRYSREQSLLTTTLDVRDRAGGALAGLAGLPADAPLSVQLTSEGNLDDWSAKLIGRGGSALDVGGTARMKRDGDWRRLDVELEAQLGAVGPAAWRGLTEGHTKLTLAVARSATGGLKIETLELEAPALRLDAGGVFNPDAQQAQGHATLTAAEGARFEPILGDAARWRDLNITARLNGAWPKPILEVEANAGEAGLDLVKAGRIAVAARAVPDRRWDEAGLRLAVSANGRATEVTSGDPTLQGVLGHALTFRANAAAGDFERFSNIAIDLNTTGAAARFVGDVEAQSIAGDVSIDAPDLSRAGMNGGRASLQARVSVERATSAWQIDGSGSADDAKTGDRSIDGLLKGKSELQFALRADASKAIEISKLTLTTPRATAQARGDIVSERLNIDATVVVQDIAIVSADMGGRAEAELHFRGPTAKPQVDGTVSVAHGKLFGQTSQILALELAEADANGVGRLTMEGDLGGKTLSANGGIAWSDPAGVRVDQAHVSLGSITLDGSLLIDDRGLLRGALALNAGALQDVAPLIDLDVAGRASGKLNFATDRGQVLDIVLTSPEARIDTARFAGLKVSGRLLDPLGTVTLDLKAQSALADFDGFVLTRVDATGKGGLKALDVAAKAMREETAVVTQARLNTAQRPTHIAVNALSVSRGAKQARLTAPVDLTIANGRVAIPSARIGAGGGQLTAYGSAGRTMDLSLNAERLPLWVSELIGETLPVTGFATGSVRMRGAASERRSEFDLKITDLTPQDAREVARNLTLAATGTTSRNGADFKATLSDPRGTTLRAAGRVPFNDAGTLSVDAQGSAELALANIYLSATGDRARGKLAVSAKVTGTLAAPRVAGGGTIKNGFFRNAQAGLELRDIEAHFEGSERHIAITGLTAKAPNGGKLNGKGDIRLDRASGFPIDLSVTAANAQLVSTNITTVVAGLDVRMSGGLMRNPVIRGSADIAQWDINVPERLARPLTPVAVVHRNAPAHIAEAGERRKETDSALSFGLDLTVRAPRRVFVRGQGINAEFGGSTKVTGTVDDPIVNGRFDLRRGAISLLSERVSLTRGAVTFSGGVEPSLDIAGTVRKSDITATISAKGKASDPVISLTSTPTLPQDEILARILFRKGTQQLSAFEAAQLAQAIAKWSGLSAGPDILDKLRTVLGIDALSATTDEEGATAVSAGSYVGSGVFLGMTQGAGSATGAANVEVELTDTIKLRGEAGATGNAKVGVAAEWEY